MFCHYVPWNTHILFLMLINSLFTDLKLTQMRWSISNSHFFFVFSECGMPVTSSDVNYCIGHPPYTMSVDSTLTSLNRKIYQEILISFKEQFSDHNTELCGWATKALIPPVLPSQLEKDCHNNLSYFISFYTVLLLKKALFFNLGFWFCAHAFITLTMFLFLTKESTLDPVMDLFCTYASKVGLTDMFFFLFILNYLIRISVLTTWSP